MRDLRLALDRLTRLCAGLCQATGLRVKLGERWAYEPSTGVLHVSRNDLASRSTEACAGIAAHEVGHLLLSRYLLFPLPPGLELAPGLDLPAGGGLKTLLMLTLNAVEDTRVEAWMMRRFPGVRAWLEAAHRETATPPGSGSAALSFLHALLDVRGASPPPRSAAVQQALEATAAVRKHLREDLLPPHDALGLLQQASLPGWSERYRTEVVPRLAPGGSSTLPSAVERMIRVLALEVREGVLRDIWPVVRALHEQDGAPEIPPDRLRFRCNPAALGPLVDAFCGACRWQRSSCGNPDYDLALENVHEQVEQLTRELQRLLLLRRRGRLQSGLTAGTRLDLRRAMAFEADRRRQEIWQRRTLADRRHAVFSLLVDLSGSMRGARIRAALEAAALFAETLSRLGVPFAINGFQDVLIPFVAFGEPWRDAARCTLGQMLQEVSGSRPGGNNRPGGNDDGPCLREAAGQLLLRPEPDRVLVVLSDGRPAGRHSTAADLLAEIEALQAEPLALVGLGLGPGTDHMQDFYPEAEANIPPENLVATVARLLERRLAGPPSPSAARAGRISSFSRNF